RASDFWRWPRDESAERETAQNGRNQLLLESGPARSLLDLPGPQAGRVDLAILSGRQGPRSRRGTPSQSCALSSATPTADHRFDLSEGHEAVARTRASGPSARPGAGNGRGSVNKWRAAFDATADFAAKGAASPSGDCAAGQGLIGRG